MNEVLLAGTPEQQAATSAPRPVDALPRLYQPAVVRHLFNSMALTYRWHSIPAAGLTTWWRRQLLARLPLAPGQRVIDLMTGTGELWPQLLSRLGPMGRVRAVDFSGAMLQAAARRRTLLVGSKQVSLHEADACCCGLATNSADIVVSAFGLKTLAPAAYPVLATEINRLLVPGGTVALVELTVPVHGWRRALCLGYFKKHWLRVAGNRGATGGSRSSSRLCPALRHAGGCSRFLSGGGADGGTHRKAGVWASLSATRTKAEESTSKRSATTSRLGFGFTIP
ncbi:class I SAM-dependent methyltransferase [Hymenobacter sp.]|jgi:demethylmenaquinone methyltransferase/2-methoxy-6-polyprenyl-1,4-benzoquinol methylase|uniref:class I SAM-dependent methyltransferase n=1 Tax=Hymenobacter sp. TaxID=1898978 RepID=UPI002ED8E71F